MKRFKDLLLSVSILSSIFIVIFVIISILNVKTTVELYLNDNTEEKLNNIKENINTLEEGECKELLLSYTSFLDRGRFDGEVKVLDLYDYLSSFDVFDYYNGAKEKCGITDEELKSHSIPNRFINIMIIPDTILDKHTFSYELRLVDELRNSVEPNIDLMAYQSYRANHSDILSNYLEIINKEVTNE